MATLNTAETKSVGEARDLLKNIAQAKPDLSNPENAWFLREAERLASELNEVHAMKGYYPS